MSRRTYRGGRWWRRPPSAAWLRRRWPTSRARRAVRAPRRVETGPLFSALHGERRGGHDFIAEALERGAAGLVVERPWEAPNDVAVFHVSDALSALQRLAAYWRARHDVRVIGVTGSAGKTTRKGLGAGAPGAPPPGARGGGWRCTGPGRSICYAGSPGRTSVSSPTSARCTSSGSAQWAPSSPPRRNSWR